MILAEFEQQVFAGGWHVHPFGDPDRHDPLVGAISFSEYVDEIERHVTSTT